MPYFDEKPEEDGAWISGCVFVVEPEVLNLKKEDNTVRGQDLLQGVVQDGLLAAYGDDGYWQPMDTLRDRNLLE